MMEILPIIKLNQPSIINVWKGLDLKYLVVRVQDLVTSRTHQYNHTFYKIKQAGSIHSYLGTDKKIILSLVMKDEIIKDFDAQMYIEIINALKPDYFTTVDGWTYEGEHEISWNEINRCMQQTMQILQKCPNIIPIGQIKGCSKQHILTHICRLKSVGIKKFMFHIGDYFRNGDKKMMAVGKSYADYINQNVDNLMLYGLSSQRRLLEYSFAKGFMTLGYFTKARHGQKIIGTKMQGERYSRHLVISNLKEMIKNTKLISNQTTLKGGDASWVAVRPLVDQALLEAQEPVTVH